MFTVVAMLFVPLLIGLALLMAWLERRLTCQMVAHEVVVAYRSSLSPEEVEAAVAKSAARVLPARSTRVA